MSNKCNKCGQENPDSAVNCSVCGEPLTTESQSYASAQQGSPESYPQQQPYNPEPHLQQQPYTPEPHPQQQYTPEPYPQQPYSPESYPQQPYNQDPYPQQPQQQSPEPSQTYKMSDAANPYPMHQAPHGGDAYVSGNPPANKPKWLTQRNIIAAALIFVALIGLGIGASFAFSGSTELPDDPNVRSPRPTVEPEIDEPEPSPDPTPDITPGPIIDPDPEPAPIEEPEPTGDVTRAEFARLVVQVFEANPTQTVDIFDDVPLTSQANVWVTSAVLRGIIAPEHYGLQFGSDEPVTREEAAVWAVRAIGVEIGEGQLRFEDRNFIAHTHEVAAAVNWGLISGMSGNMFNPNDTITHAQAAEITARITDAMARLRPGVVEEVIHFVYRSDVTVVGNPSAYTIAESADAFIVTIPGGDETLRGLSEGETFVLAPTAQNPSGLAGHFVSAQESDGELIITASAPESISDVFDEFEYAGNIDILSSNYEITLPNHDDQQITLLSNIFPTAAPTSLVYPGSTQGLSAQAGDFTVNFRETSEYFAVNASGSMLGININGELRLYRPTLTANICINKEIADLFVTAKAELDFDLSASFGFDTVIPLFEISVFVYGVVIDIPVGIRVSAEGAYSLEIMTGMSLEFGIIGGNVSTSAVPTLDFNFNHETRAAISLNIQAKASVLKVPAYGIQGDFGKGFLINDLMQDFCPEYACFAVEVYHVRNLSSLNWGALSYVSSLSFNVDLARHLQSTHYYNHNGSWHKNRCPHGGIAGSFTPVSQPSELVPNVLVSSESELRAAIGNAGSSRVVIGMTDNIDLISNLVIPSGKDIALISYGVNMLTLMSMRDMDVIEIEADASLIIENVWITRMPGTTGSGVTSSGTFTMNSGIISGNTNSGVYSSTSQSSFTMNSGLISDNTSSYGGGVYAYGTFIMNGGEISNNSASYGGGVQGGPFTMNGGSIRNNIATNDGGGVRSGTFTMYGGSITGNTSRSNGGGVHGAVDIHNGNISGNTARYGGGIYARGNSTMHGGSITFNEGGGVYVDGTFTMNGGAIIGNNNNNNDTWSSGGVYGTIVMNDGIISGNSTSGDGGGVRGTLTMNGGTIEGNSAQGAGGGLSGNLTMSGGSIHNNTANGSGGGVHNTHTFTMSGGTIHSNTAGGSGGGVNNLDHNSTTFTLDGGWIFNNNATDGVDVSVGQRGEFNNNVWDNNIGGISVVPPGFVAP